MENNNHEQDPESGLVGVFEISGEPAIVINGVPEVAPASDGTIICCNKVTDEKPSENNSFGEWLEGREVRKLFGGQYYFGKVTMFDKDAGWYRVVYDDGDFEDLEWNELEEVLLPLDVTIPLKTLAMKMLRKSINPTCTSGGKGAHTSEHSALGVKKKATLSGKKRGRPRKVEVEKMEDNANLTSLTEVARLEKVEENAKLPIVIKGGLVENFEENGKSSGRKRGRPRKIRVEKMDENAKQTVLAEGVLVAKFEENATISGATKGAYVEKVEGNGKPSGKKRGRPRKLESVEVEESAKLTTIGASLEKVKENINLSVVTEVTSVEKFKENVKPSVVTDGASVEKVPEKRKPSGKKRGRPRKVQMENVDGNAKLTILTAGDSVEKLVESAKPAVAMEKVEENVRFRTEKIENNAKLPMVIQGALVGKVGEKGNPSGKKRGRPRKVQVEKSEENAKLAMGTEGASMGMVEERKASDGKSGSPRKQQAERSFNPSGRKRGRPRKLQGGNAEQDVKQTMITERASTVNTETFALG